MGMDGREHESGGKGRKSKTTRQTRGARGDAAEDGKEMNGGEQESRTGAQNANGGRR
jgi:hypothetical protein